MDTDEAYKITFGKVPSNYTVQDIMYHLCFKSNSEDTISDSKLERCRRAIRRIHFDDNQKEWNVIFSSIFYWCKCSRNVLKQKQLSAVINPKCFQPILPSLSIDFIVSNCNNQLLKLYNLSSSNVSYIFVHDNTIYISWTLKSNRELLLKIPSSTLSDIKLLNLSVKNEAYDKEKGGDTDVILGLKEPCELYECFHRGKLWICTGCGSVNNAEIKTNRTILEMKCVCCNDV